MRNGEQTETQLQAAVLRLDVAMSAANLVWWEMDCRTGRTLFDTRRAGLLGHDPGELTHSSDFAALIHPDDIEATTRAMGELCAGKSHRYDVEFRMRTKNEGYRWFHQVGVVGSLDDSGSPGTVMGFIADVHSLKQSQAELQRSHEELRALAAHLQLVREEERAAVAWELHDEIAQALAALKMDIYTSSGRLPAAVLAIMRPKMEAMIGVLDGTIERLRNLYSDLRPGMLDDLGLAATIEWQASEFERRSGIKCRVLKADPVRPRGADCALALYRVFQEALDNVVRHSGATGVEVGIEQRDRYLTLRVSDNGRGITEEEMASPSALGLAGMRERALACGGKLVVRRGDGGGTIVEASAPAALPGKDGDAA